MAYIYHNSPDELAAEHENERSIVGNNGQPAGYTYLSESEWTTKIARVDALAQKCRLCPRNCGVKRFEGEKGFCGAPDTAIVSSIFAHHGEEPPITGTNGSGTVFFSHCTLKCLFCQNYQISHEGEGIGYSAEELADKMLWLQTEGCHNVNFVTPTHFLPQILRAIRIASKHGLHIPLVYNCGGYESVDTLRALHGIIDVYLPDMKYGENGPAVALSSASDYVERNRAAIREMFRQVGPLRLDENGFAYRGICIRHLVLPEKHAGSSAILDFLTKTYDPEDITMSIMAQYRPVYRSHEAPAVNRSIFDAEYIPIMKAFKNAGFAGYYQNPPELDKSFLINFKKRKHEPLKGD